MDIEFIDELRRGLRGRDIDGVVRYTPGVAQLLKNTRQDIHEIRDSQKNTRTR